MHARYLLEAVSVVAILALLLGACQPSTPEPDQVTLQLNWTHEAVFAGYYVAQAQGFYEGENLAVTIREGGMGIDATQLLVSGEADFAVFAFDEYKQTMEAENRPIAVMAVQQLPPNVLLALSDSGIRSPQDLVGRRVAVKNEVWRQIIHDLLDAVGVDAADIVEVDVEWDAIEKLYDGKVDVWTGYVHDEPTEARMAGYDVNLIFTADYGVGVYGDLLVVGQDTLERSPDGVGRFVRASRRGWQYAVEHPDEAAEVIAQRRPEHSLEFHQIGMRALVPLVDTGQVPIGWIDADRWRMALGEAYDPKRPGYSMEFVKEE
jgi:ABC-type nitrate/sulfonate/bicarbonate transport system substrate-binding protein